MSIFKGDYSTSVEDTGNKTHTDCIDMTPQHSQLSTYSADADEMQQDL